MNKSMPKTPVNLLLLFIILLYGGKSYSAEAGEAPVIHIDPTTHTFPPVFEGEQLSHTFTVFNKGTADLHIKDVTHS